jgi:hypothetical protein
MTLGQLCAALWDSQSRTVVIQPGIEPVSVVTRLALRCSALDHRPTQEPKSGVLLLEFNMSEGEGLRKMPSL